MNHTLFQKILHEAFQTYSSKGPATNLTIEFLSAFSNFYWKNLACRLLTNRSSMLDDEEGLVLEERRNQQATCWNNKEVCTIKWTWLIVHKLEVAITTLKIEHTDLKGACKTQNQIFYTRMPLCRVKKP